MEHQQKVSKNDFVFKLRGAYGRYADSLETSMYDVGLLFASRVFLCDGENI